MADTIKSTDVPSVHGLVALNPDGTAIGTPVGGATASNQTDGSQKTQIVDAGGEVATVTGGKLDVNATASLAGQAIPATGATEAVTVQIVDGSGNQIASFGGGTQYTEDAAAAANPVGNALIVVREDARAGSLTTADGDNVALRGNNKGELYVKTTDSDALLTTIDADTGTIATEVAGLLTDAELRATPVPVSGTVTANLSATDNAVLDAIEVDTTTIAGAVAGTEMQVDVLTSALPTGASTLAEQQSQTTHLATIAGDTTSIQTAVELVDDTVATLGTTTYTEAATKGLVIGAVRRDADTTLVDTTNEVTPLQVDASGRLKVEAFSGETLPVSLTSTTVTGTVAVTQSGTWDEVGINDSGNSITIDNAQLSVVGSGTEAAAMRVTIATDSTGVLSVDDNGSSLTVDGTVAVTGVSTLAEQQTQTTALQLIDDVVYTDDTSTHSTGTSKGVGIMGVAVPTDTSISANDIGMIAMSTDRRQFVDATLQLADTDISATNALPTKGVPSDIDTNGSNANHADKYYTNSGAVTDGIVWSPAAGKRWHVLTLYINVSAAATVTLEDDLAGGDVARWKGELAANSGVVLTYDKEHPFCSGEDAADLIITTTAGNVYVQAVGYEI